MVRKPVNKGGNVSNRNFNRAVRVALNAVQDDRCYRGVGGGADSARRKAQARRAERRVQKAILEAACTDE